MTTPRREFLKKSVLGLTAPTVHGTGANGGKPNEECNKAFAELIDIYHAQNAEPHVRPPLVK